MDNFYKPHANSNIALKIQDMPMDSKARKVLAGQNYSVCGWMVDGWILTDLMRDLEEIEHSPRNPHRAAYLLQIFKKAVRVNDEGSSEILSEGEVHLCNEYWIHYNLLSTVKDWINEGETSEIVYNVLLEMEDLDRQIKSNL